SANWLGLESEEKLKGRGVSACATCDGFFFQDKEVVVVGGGDSAMEEATFLTKFVRRVTVIHRRDQLRASKIMQEKSVKNPKIDFMWDSVVDEILGVEKNEVTGVRVRNVKTGEIKDFPYDGVFVAIGHTPNTHVVKGKLEMDTNGYITTQSHSTKTSVPGVFACGDAQDSYYRQAVTAAGTGCMAAIDAEKFLEEEEAED
ncbi:MAG: FAD-dependent oxidoreductase, partial [bacterium]